MDELGHGFDAALDDILEEVYSAVVSADVHLRSPTGWLSTVVDAIGAFAGRVVDDPRESLTTIAAVCIGAMDAHSIPAEPGTSADPAVLLALTFHEATALVRERGWVDGDHGVWTGRLAAVAGAYAVTVVAWHEDEPDARPLEIAGPAAMTVAATALLAAAALPGHRG